MAKRKGRAKAGEIPWDEIERIYVQGEMVEGRRVFPSHREIAERFELSIEAVQRRGSASKWGEKRAAFTAQVTAQVRQKCVNHLATDLFERIKRRAELGEKILVHIDAALTGKPLDGVKRITPLNLQRLQATLKAQADTDRADLALDPKRGVSEESEEATDSTVDALVDAVMDGIFAQNQAPAEGEAGFDVERE